jgi:hypothetical protein
MFERLLRFLAAGNPPITGRLRFRMLPARLIPRMAVATLFSVDAFALRSRKAGTASRLARASNPGYALRHGSKNDRLGTCVSVGEVWSRRRANGDCHLA